MENAVALHGDISQNERLNNLNAFARGEDDYQDSSSQRYGRSSRNNRGTVKTLIATDVAARGLDIPNVELVINTEPPAFAESYIHRSGRTGRMGKSGKCITLFNRENFRNLISLQSHARISIKEIPMPNLADQRSMNNQ